MSLFACGLIAGALLMARTSEARNRVEKAGVEFIPEDDLKGPGVRLKESTRSKTRRKRKSSG